MKCPKCQFEIPHGLKFCVECGHILENLPKGILDKVLSHRSKIEGEKKEVTVMFCDMAGFTPLVEKIGIQPM